MKTKIPSALSVWLFLGLAPWTLAQKASDNLHRSPRATVRALLTAVTLARGAPHQIQTAVSCLDLSGLSAAQRNNAGLLATHLEAILRATDVDTNLIPDDTDETVY